MKVAIIGSRTRREHFRPSEGAEVWGLNAIRPSWAPTWSRMFNLHFFQRLLDYGYDVQKDRAWAQENRQVPFYVCDPWPEAII